MPLVITEEAFKTDTGRQRNANEDSYFARSPVFAVADGMGGAQAGEVASRIAATAFERSEIGDEPAETQLEQIATSANQEIHDLAQRDSTRAGMGTTLTAALFRDDEVALGHVGDSRAYVLRDGELKRLTKDHSLVEELRRQGRLTEEEAEEHPQRSIITRALGPEPDVKVDTMTFQAKTRRRLPALQRRADDDGLRRGDHATSSSSARSLRSAVNKLIDAANSGGGRDNITAVAFRRRRGGRGGGRRGRDPDLAHRRAGRPHRRAHAPGGRPPARPGPDAAAAPPPPRAQDRRRDRRDRGRARRAASCSPARSTSSAPTRTAGSRSTAACPTSCRSGSTSTRSSSRSASRPRSLSPERQDVVTEHKLRSEDDARDIVDDIEDREGSEPLTPATPAPAGEDTKKKQDPAAAPQAGAPANGGQHERPHAASCSR